MDLLETLVKDYNCDPNATSSVLRKYTSFLADAGLHHSQRYVTLLDCVNVVVTQTACVVE